MMGIIVKNKSVSTICVFFLLIGSGCSISYSVDQSSESIAQSLDSISGSFESITSISTSSGSGKQEVAEAMQRFKEDIAALTHVFLKTENDAPYLFEKQLGEVAQQYGILDWENDPQIYFAIGGALRESGIHEAELDGLTMLQSSVMKQNKVQILEGYQEV